MPAKLNPAAPGRLRIQTADEGHGPLWQRDYQGVIVASTLSPEAIIELIRARLPEFSPALFAAFRMETKPPLAVGDDMPVFIQGYGDCCVRCVHVDARSLTLRTLEGHFEAGRITFGAFFDAGGNTVFQIRSRARSVGRLGEIGYKILGRKLQAQVWLSFVERVAEETGGKLLEKVRRRTRAVPSTLADMGEIDTPTFIARDKKPAPKT